MVLGAWCWVTEPGKEEETIIRLSRVGYDQAIGYLNGGFPAWEAAGKEVDTVKRISAAEFAQRYPEKPTVFDVRKKSEFESEHVVDAINVPLNTISQHLAEFPKDAPFILHCAGTQCHDICGAQSRYVVRREGENLL